MPVPYFDWIAHHAGRRPGATAAVDLGAERRLSYADLDRRIEALAGHLRHGCAVAPGARVAVLAQNTTDILEVQFACWRIGALFVPLNWRLALPELDAIVADCSPEVLVHDDGFAGQAETLGQRRAIAHRVCRGGEGSRYEQAISEGRALGPPHRATHDDPCTILYTSGTTGLPKGSITTHGMNVWNAVNSTVFAALSADTVSSGLLPLFHTAGLNCWANPVLHAGGAVLVSRSFDPADALRLVADPGAGMTHLAAVPAIYLAMAHHPDFAGTDLSRLRHAIVGAAPTPTALLETWRGRGVALQQVFGMTEGGPLVLVLEAADAARKAGSAGKPVMHSEVRVVDADGRSAEPGRIGEMQVRGPAITPGYWNNPQATRAAFADGGWLRTGDAVQVDGEGFYTVVDRWKDMYISGGENVYPAEVENVLYRLPGIAEVAVIGVADPRWGEVGRAIVVAKPGSAPTEEEVFACCAASLARYKVPRSVVFAESLPRTASGKLHKPTLRERYGASPD